MNDAAGVDCGNWQTRSVRRARGTKVLLPLTAWSPPPMESWCSSSRTASDAYRKKQMRVARGLVRLCTRARVVGVAFWDSKHGQTGVAPNAIELHPILGFACLSSKLPPPPPPPVPRPGGKCAASYPTVCIPPPHPTSIVLTSPCATSAFAGCREPGSASL